MACPAIITGEQFLGRVLAHIDCQAQVIGSYGFQALGQPGSTASIIVSGLLAIFIALFGIRLLFGPPPGARDVVFDVLKIGIVLTLAFSWPAFRTVVYDVTLKAPAEIASIIATSSGNVGPIDLPSRLQRADVAMSNLTAIGTGRNTGQFLDAQGAGANFAGTGLQDDAAFGYGRLLYLSGVIGSLALLRIGAGLLLALAPVVAALWFFSQSRGIFAGWLKGLVFTIAGSIGATILLTVELAIVEPWLADALRVRGLGYAIPSAPTELFAMMLAFVIVKLAMLWLLAKVVFYRGWATIPDIPRLVDRVVQPQPEIALPVQGQPVQILRAERISNTIENAISRERSVSSERLVRNTVTGGGDTAERPTRFSRDVPRLGSSYRRPSTRPSRAATQRDST